MSIFLFKGGYIYSVEGISGLYRGLGMKIVSHSVSTYVYARSRRVLYLAFFRTNLSFK